MIGQRIGDITKLKWSDIRDGKIYIIQSKTGARIAIPTNLRLECIGYSIDDVLINLNNNGKLICDVGVVAIRNNFSKCLPELENKPTFHEIRSLSARLWEVEKGTEFSSKLLGHKSLIMTKKYLDKRDDSFVDL